MSAREVDIRCERCGDSAPAAPPSLAWLGRHAHGTQTVAYRAWWATTPEETA